MIDLEFQVLQTGYPANQQENLTMKPDSPVLKETNTSLSIGGNLFGFSYLGSVTDDNEKIE